MNHKMPRTPFSMPLSRSARELERRIRSICSGPKKDPPLPIVVLTALLALLCGNLASCQAAEAEPDRPDVSVNRNHLASPNLTLASVDWNHLPDPDPVYTLTDSGNVQIEGLEGAYAEWNRSRAGNFLHFAGDPAFCCPSLAGRTAEGTVQWQGEPFWTVAVDITVNDDRLEDGTGYSLRFTVDWSKQTVLESSFLSEAGDGNLELTEKEMLHACRVLHTLMYEAEWTATAVVTILDAAPDLNRNGVPEEVRWIVPDRRGGQRLEVREDGRLLYESAGDRTHAGWNAVFLCTLDGEDYLLRYDPCMGQGAAGYHYWLFTLEGGEEHVVQSNELYFEINFWMPAPGGVVDPDDIFDPEEIADFMDEINGLLSRSVQLLNTNESLLWSFARKGRLVDILEFMYLNPEVFTPDPEKSLRENLWDYRNTWVQRVSER